MGWYIFLQTKIQDFHFTKSYMKFLGATETPKWLIWQKVIFEILFNDRVCKTAHLFGVVDAVKHQVYT